MSDQDLLVRFESLGDTVELGYIQRECGVEPLGLFRFTGCTIDSVCHVLETHLQHLFTGDDLEMINDPGDGRVFFRSRYYNDFFLFAVQRARKVSVDAIVAQERSKFAYLKRRFLEDLKSGEKIFVRKGSDALRDLRRLQRALAAHGSHKLLIVNLADADHPVGTVERLGPGLFRGFVSNFKVCLRPEPFDVAGWLDVLRTTYRMTQPRAVCALPHRIDAGSDWHFSETFEVSEVSKKDRPAQDQSGSVHRIAQNWDAPVREVVAWHDVSTSGLAAQDMVVFSTWVYVHPGLFKQRLFVSFEGVPSKHEHPYDLKRTDCWQRVWSSMRMPRDGHGLTARLCTEFHLNVPILLGGWRFEKGSSPSIEAPGVHERFTTWQARRRRTAMLRAARNDFEAREKTSASLCAWANTLISHRAFVEADDLLSEAVAAAPKDAALAKAYATSAHNSARYVAAGHRWSRALDLDPHDPMCFAGFASNLREHVSLARARDVIESALGRFPDNMIVLTEAARIAEATHRCADALPYLEKAIALHGAHPELVFARDRVRQAIGL